jgi:selenide, water dikinase
VFAAFQSNPMRCGGCGAKVGSSTLSRVLRAVQKRQQTRAAALGLPPPPAIEYDDAAVTLLPNAATGSNHKTDRQAIIQTIDFFREMINDPFIFGKVAAIHSLSDIHAMGASAQTAMVLAVAPFAADESITESTLLHLLSGVSDVLQDENIRLVGGHTCEGHELSCGLSVQGFTQDRTTLLNKKGGKIGDKIVLTKPIGTGALFAAEMRGRCKGEYVGEAIEWMLKSNLVAGQVASEFSVAVHACTDVTGFGLIGHLLEMLTANDADPGHDPINAVLNIERIKFLKGGLEASRQHIYSSLQPQNARNRRAVHNHAQASVDFAVQYPLLFDPQTAGGLLLFVAAERCDEFVQVLQHKDVDATVIGSLEQRQGPKTTEQLVADTPFTCGLDAIFSTDNRIRIDYS